MHVYTWILHLLQCVLTFSCISHTGNMQYTSLKDVNASSQQWTVQARLVRFCKYLSPDEPNKIRRLDLVLLDEEVMDYMKRPLPTYKFQN